MIDSYLKYIWRFPNPETETIRVDNVVDLICWPRESLYTLQGRQTQLCVVLSQAASP
jgi:hypothetical protein